MELKTLNNQAGETVYKELKNNIKKGSKLSVISAYFTMYAYYELRKDLNKIDNMRFIFTTPNFVKNTDKQARQYEIDNNAIFGNDFELKLKNEMTQGHISKECYNWINEKVDIKSFKIPNVAQPRMIHIANDNSDDVVINGSVDFTTDGLGISSSDRVDMNTLAVGDTFSEPHRLIFDTLWENEDLLEDVKEEVLNQMKVMYEENSPEFIYFKTLYYIFYNYLDELDDGNIVKKGNKLKETKIWNTLYKFQKDAVMGAIDKIEKYNGCILADSVGLGKTFTALAVIQYYELRNDRVLVLVPKKLRDNWTIYTLNDKRNIFDEDRFRYDVLNHTDLSRDKGKSGDIDLSMINWGNYDLVVIDESHNFRNNPAVEGRMTRYEKLMKHIIKEGHKTKLLMLSATPVNNRMTDIKNQIAFITEDNPYALADIGINNINSVLTKAQMIFNRWSALNDDVRTGEKFIDMMDADYFKLLDTLTIARSRKHIEKYYNLDEIGRFPNRLTPINMSSDIDTEKEFPSFGEINDSISRLNLAVFNPFSYILPTKIESYELKYDKTVQDGRSKFRQRDRDENIVRLMRTNLLKRAESSIYSFKLTVERLLYKIKKALEKIDSGNYIGRDLDINLIDPEEEEYDDMMFGGNIKVLMQDMDLIKWRESLEDDERRLKEILQYVKKVTPERDEKLADLKEVIANKIENPINEDNKKVLVFTAFADTAEYLYENISKWAYETYGMHSAIVSGSKTNKSTLKLPSSDINDVLTSFSPISKERNLTNPDMDEEIDILIGTDCISEGQNLQDCDYLINYDIHWNPVRIIQRFGRIDRIGSKNEDIQLVNFWPNMELDEYIGLKGRVENRMVIVDVSATGEENIIEDGDKQVMNDLEYRRNQLEKLQSEVVDLEDLSNAISITDLTFNDFKIELMDYLKEHKEELENAPEGLYSVVPVDDFEDVEPGVIFLLKQVRGKLESEKFNTLTPYYLVYISDSGEVKLNYIQSKKVLDYYKKLCSGQSEVYRELINEFDRETDDGRDMSKYSELLSLSIEDILGKKEETGVKSLFSKGGTTPVKHDISGLEEFKLITFLILK